MKSIILIFKFFVLIGSTGIRIMKIVLPIYHEYQENLNYVCNDAEGIRNSVQCMWDITGRNT